MPTKTSTSGVSSDDTQEVLTYENFDIEAFKREQSEMEQFRASCYGEQIELTWKKLQTMYLPTTMAVNGIHAKYTINTSSSATSTASPDVVISAEDDELLEFNEPLVAIKVHTALSLLTQRTPDVKWDSDNDEYEKNVMLVNALRTSDWQDGQTRQQYVMLWFYNVLYGTTYWRRYYEKLEREVSLPSSIDMSAGSEEPVMKFEKQTIVDFDATAGEALSPFQVWIDPATVPMKPRTMRKVMWEKVYTRDDFIRRFESVVSKTVLDEVQGTAVTGFEGTNNVKCRYYENMDLDLYYVAANDSHEIVKDHLPQNHKQISILMAIWMPRSDSNPFGMGPIEMMAEDKRALDKFKSMTMTQVKFSVYKAIFYTGSLQTDSGESGEISIRPDHAYKVSEKPFFLNMPGPGNDSWQAITTLRERIDDASGINRPLGGEIVKTTAFQTDLAKDAALARLSVPISNIVLLLAKDAELTFELQKQYYALPKVEELVDADAIAAAYDELEKLKAEGKANFDLFVDQGEEVDEETGMPMNPRVFKGTYREMQLNVNKTPSGQYIPSMTKNTAVITGENMKWKGKFYVIADSILSITPTVEKTRKLEMYNLLIPMFSQPPQLVAKPAYSIVKLYGEDPEEVLPDSFLQFLQASQQGLTGVPMQPNGAPPVGAPQGVSPEAAAAMGGAPMSGGMPPGAPNLSPDGAMNFQQRRAPRVVTNINGQKDNLAASSQALR